MMGERGCAHPAHSPPHPTCQPGQQRASIHPGHDPVPHGADSSPSLGLSPPCPPLPANIQRSHVPLAGCVEPDSTKCQELTLLPSGSSPELSPLSLSVTRSLHLRSMSVALKPSSAEEVEGTASVKGLGVGAAQKELSGI